MWHRIEKTTQGGDLVLLGLFGHAFQKNDTGKWVVMDAVKVVGRVKTEQEARAMLKQLAVNVKSE